jgi:hypothetical protein
VRAAHDGVSVWFLKETTMNYARGVTVHASAQVILIDTQTLRY